MDRDDDRVNVGNFDSNGLNVNNYPVGYRVDYLGVSSARMFSFLLNENALPFGRAFLLAIFCGLYPTSQHSSNLIRILLKQNILLTVNRFYFFGEADENPE